MIPEDAQLIDGEERARRSCAFDIPSAIDRFGLSMGDVVKIGLESKTVSGRGPSGERFWVKIRGIVTVNRRPEYVGELLQDLTVWSMKRRASIRFGPQHVLGIEDG